MKKRIKKIPIMIVSIILIFIITIISLYIFHENYRNWVDIYILRKDITEEDIITIDLDTDKSNQVHVYNKYIAILNNQIITLYNNFGEEITNINININNAIFDSNEKYLAIAEKGGGEICLILDKNYLWSNKIDGEILQIHVNRNGYLAVVTKDSTYKSILTIYNSDGTQLFKNYFAETKIIDVSISEDNKYVAIGELDFSGALIKSSVKVLSIENAKKGEDDAYIYNADNGKILVDVEYQSKSRIACMYDNSISIIENKENKDILNIDEKQITFMSVNLDNSVVFVEEEKTGVFKTNSHVNILNTKKNSISKYNLKEVPKGLYTSNDIIAVNLGTEIYFLNSNAWLIKKYSTKKEISNVIFSKNLAGIIYKDKIVIVNL